MVKAGMHCGLKLRFTYVVGVACSSGRGGFKTQPVILDSGFRYI